MVVTLKSTNVGAVRVSVSPLGFADLARPVPDLSPTGHRIATADPVARSLVRQLATLEGGKAWSQVVAFASIAILFQLT